MKKLSAGNVVPVESFLFECLRVGALAPVSTLLAAVLALTTTLAHNDLLRPIDSGSGGLPP